MTLNVTSVRFSRAKPEFHARGLLGWCVLGLDDGFELGGVALRRKLTGDLGLSFPTQRDVSGRHHPILRPISQNARDSIEARVLQLLRDGGHIS